MELLNGFAEWMERLNYSEKSIQERTAQLKTFLKWIENRHIQSLSNCTQLDLEAYNKYLHQKPLKSKTIIGYIGALKLCNQYLENHGEEPILTTKLIIGKDLEESRKILSKAAINQLYEATESTIWGMRDRIIIAIFYGCGLRSKEGRSLELIDIDFKLGVVHVKKGKGGKERYVPMSTGVNKELQNWIANGHPFFSPKTNLLIPNSRGKQANGHGLNKRLKRLCEMAKTKEISLHGLRHSIATHLLQSGMSLDQIGQFLGHSSLESTQIYTRINEDI